MTTENINSKTRPSSKTILGEPMTPEVHLVKTLWFRLAIAGPIAIAIFTAWIFTMDTNLRWSFTPEGMNNFLNLFKLPVGIASVSLPLAAVVAANHRSMQTAQQIQEQNSQNIFANHLQHRNFFFKFIEDFDPFHGIEVSTPKLYETMFPRAVNGHLEPNRLATNHFIGEIMHTNDEINKELKDKFDNNEILIHSENLKSLIGDYYVHRKIYTGTSYSFDEIENTKNLYQLTVKTVYELETMANGILMCANFHRNFIDKLDDPSFEEFEDQLINSKSVLSRLQKKQGIHQELKLALHEYVDKNNEFRKDLDNAPERFSARLSTLPNNLELENGSDDFKEVTLKYFTDNERRIIREHAPNTLKMSL